jgi:hypothetical protein
MFSCSSSKWRQRAHLQASQALTQVVNALAGPRREKLQANNWVHAFSCLIERFCSSSSDELANLGAFDWHLRNCWARTAARTVVLCHNTEQLLCWSTPPGHADRWIQSPVNWLI